MLKSLVFRFFEAFSKPTVEQKLMEAIKLEQQQEGWKMIVENYRDTRAQKYKDWSKPRNIKKRRRKEAKRNKKALRKMLIYKRKMREAQGLPLEDAALPDPLPDRFKGQSESTIRAMLRHEAIGEDKL